MYRRLESTTPTSSKFSESSIDETDTIFSTPQVPTKPKLQFPPTARKCFSANNSCASSCTSDSSVSDGRLVKKKGKKGEKRRLPPIGIFWDIENCQVPKNKSAFSLVHRIRELFLVNFREVEFLVVCDVKKENAQVIQDLHDTQVNLIHVCSTSKNAADEKLRQYLRRFAEIYKAPSAIVLISSDVNFAADLSDLRYRRKIHVILVHNANVADALILCASETYSFSEITENLPQLKREKSSHATSAVDLLISNLPLNCDPKRVKTRLKMLTDNCGGRVVNVISEFGLATVRFANNDTAFRAQKRIQGEDVYGNKIRVVTTTSTRKSPVWNFGGRRLKNHDLTSQQAPTWMLPLHTVPILERNNQTFGNGASNKSKSLQEIAGKFPKAVDNWRLMSNPLAGNQENGAAACAATQSRSANSQEDTKNRPTSSLPIDLFISNLDPNMDVRETRKMILGMLKEHVMVLGLKVSVDADGSPVANLKVGTQQEAQYIVSQLHRQKIGHKRIVVSYQNVTVDPNQLKAMVIALLQEAPGKSMPLFKLLYLLETRYHSSISISEVNKLKDVCKITGDAEGRIVKLAPELRVSPPPILSSLLTPYCTVHCPNGIESRGWGESDTTQAPNIMMPLKLFEEKVIGLLTSHMGALPLLSFRICYEIEYKQPLPIDDAGVPLEHLLTCVSNVALKCCGPNKNIKYIIREIKSNESEEDNFLSVPSALAPNLNLLSREIVELLKTMDRCQLHWSRFIPAYHHHFGRQCRVADYGCTKLMDLFELIPHVVQLMGDVNRRVITLSHQAQMRRFTYDLLRILRSQPSKQLSVSEFPAAFERILGKPLNAVEYGLCSLEDLLSEVPKSTVVINKSENGKSPVISIPKREQTPEEMERTRQFASEVVQLLHHAPQHTMLFNKFVPAYHHHFGYQCKVSFYGFTKLIELFESISDVVKVVQSNAGPLLVLRNPEADAELTIRVWSILWENFSSSFSDFLFEYQSRFGTYVTVSRLERLQNVVKITDENRKTRVSLKDKYILAAELYKVAYSNGGEVTWDQLFGDYSRIFGKKLKMGSIGVENANHLVEQFNFLFVLKVNKRKVTLVLNKKLAEYKVKLPASLTADDEDKGKLSVQWPLPPVYENVGRSSITPPKPDTPPSTTDSFWLQQWSTPPKCELTSSFTIDLPSMEMPELFGKGDSLISPTRNLLSAHSHPLGAVIPMITAPDPTQLPLPDKLLAKGSCDDSNDSGVINNSHIQSEEVGMEGWKFGIF